MEFILEDPTHTAWTKWDYRLAKALELRDQIMSGNVPIYWDRSDRVAFEVGTFVSKSKAALDRAEEKARDSKTKNYGKIFYPIPKTIDGGPLPTMEEFSEEQATKREMSAGNFVISPTSEFDNAFWVPEPEAEPSP